MAKANWLLDQAHSELGFTVKHMMISKVKGTFDKFDLVVEADPENLSDAKVEATIDVASINTRNDGRDDHLRGSDFFDVEKYPNMTFKATNITKKSDSEYELTGDLTIRDTTRSIPVNVIFEGLAKDPMGGKTVAGFSGNAVINRTDFGLTWNAALETGGVLVGEDIKIHFELELQKED